MKKTLSLLLALLTVFSVLTVAVSAAQTEPLTVFDMLKHSADGNTKTCYTIEILFQQNMCNLDSSKEITFRSAKDETVAVCRPYSDNICKYDLYTPDGDFGVAFDPTQLYYLTIPEGTYYTNGGVICAAYRGEYNGVNLSDTNARYTLADLGISDYLATNTDAGRLYSGRIRIDLKFDVFLGGAGVTLYRRIGDDKYEKIGVFPFSTTNASFKKGSADVTFGGVKIDRYETYKLHVDFGTFMSGTTTINDHSEYVLSGKKLLGLREDYPAIDLLIGWFGADHWTLKAITTVLDLLAKVRLVDKALAKDVKDYIRAKKGA